MLARIEIDSWQNHKYFVNSKMKHKLEIMESKIAKYSFNC